MLEIPAILKKQLLDEFELVTGSQKTVNLPRHPNVKEGIKMFQFRAPVAHYWIGGVHG